MSKKLPRLSYGFMSASADAINIKLPWQFSNQDGMFKMNYSPEKALEDSLRFWAQTNRGEYVYDLGFGLDVRRSLFLPGSILKDTVINNARKQLPKYFPNFKPSLVEVLSAEDRSDISEHQVIFSLEGILFLNNKHNIRLQEKIGT